MTNHRRWPLPLLFCILLFAQIGCSNKKPPAKAAAKNPSPATRPGRLQLSATTFPLEVTDVLERRLELPRRPLRIVSLTPANTEILFAVGAGEQVVGVTTQCNYPAAAAECEKVGGFLASSISLEKIVDLQPDFVLAAGGFHGSTIEALTRLKIRVIAVEPRTFDDLFSTIESIGALTGHAMEATELVESLRGRAETVKKTIAELPAADRLRVFYQVNADPLMTVGNSAFIAEMIEWGGGMNVFADLAKPYPQVSEEAVLERNPQVILAPSPEQSGGTRVKTSDGWEGLEAVKRKRIHYLDADLVSRPGPRLIDAVEAVARAMYPEKFPKPR